MIRRLLPAGITTIAIAAVLAATAAVTALAYFTTEGNGESTPKEVSQLAKPVVTATPGVGGTVTLSWNEISAPGIGTLSYSVSRIGGKAGGSCGSTLSVTTCTDSGLEPGSYEYVVTAKWRSWTAASAAKTATVTIGPLDHLALTATSSTPTAGTTDNLTITAMDADGNTVTSYAGAKSLTFSGASAAPSGAAPTVSDSSGNDVPFGSATPINFSAGEATVNAFKNGAMKLYKSGSTSLSVSDGSVSTETPLTVTVSAATASKLVLAAASATAAAGEADNLTITARDAYENTATGYTGSKSLTFSGAATVGANKPTVTSSSGSATAFGTATAIAFTAGIATVSSSKNGQMKIYASGEADVSASDGTISSPAPLEVTVSPLAASKFVLSAATTTPAAGEADNLTTTAQDTYGNVATGYTGSKNLTYSGASAAPNGTGPTVTDSSGSAIAFGSATTVNFNAGVATVSAGKNGAMKLYKGGSTALKVSDGTITTPTALTVTVGTTAGKLVLTAAATALAAGEADNLTVTAQDAYENTATSYTGSKNLTFSGAATVGTNKPTVINSSGTAVAFGTATSISFTAGVATVASAKNGVMKIYAAGKANVSVSDGTISSPAPLEVTVSPLAASKLALTAATTTPVAGAADNLTVTAQDTYGNTDPAYTGAKSLTYSGASASPGGTSPTVSDSAGNNIAFGSATPTSFAAGVAGVSGNNNGVMKLYKIGAATITVSDGTLSGTLATTTSSTATKLILAAESATPAPAAADNLTITAQDPYTNTVTSYTGSKNLTFSGASASPNGTAPTVANSSGTATNFGTATAITFTSGVATVVSSTKNGVMKLYKAESANVSVTDGTISSTSPVAITVSPAAASKWALTNISISAGSMGSTCLFTCTVTGLGNSGTVKAKVAVTDTYGNTVSALGSGHSAKVTVTSGSGTVSGSPLAIPATGAAETATTFTFTSKSSGSFTETITAAAQEGTAYTTATLTASK